MTMLPSPPPWRQFCQRLGPPRVRASTPPRRKSALASSWNSRFWTALFRAACPRQAGWRSSDPPCLANPPRNALQIQSCKMSGRPRLGPSPRAAHGPQNVGGDPWVGDLPNLDGGTVPSQLGTPTQWPLRHKIGVSAARGWWTLNGNHKRNITKLTSPRLEVPQLSTLLLHLASKLGDAS